MVNNFSGFARNKLLLLGFPLVVLVFFCILSNPFQFYFLNDDFIHIPLAAKGKFLHGNLLRPVADISLWADNFLYGKNAAGFHFTNVFIHLLNTILVFFLYRKILVNRGSYSVVRPLTAAALFLIYAFHSESVFWIIGRGGSLSCLFILLSLSCFLYSPSLWSLAAALFSFCIGLFTYEFTWVLPLLIFIFGRFALNVSQKTLLVWTSSFFAVFIIYFLVRINVAGVHFGNYESGLLQEGSIQRLAYNYATTIARSFLPPMKNGNIFLAIFISAVITFIVTLVYCFKRKHRHLMMYTAAILISCLPSIALGIDTHDQEGERFLYLSSVFCCLFLVEFVFLFIRPVAGKVVILVLVFAVHGQYFYLSSRSYRFASSVAKQSLECLASATGVTELEVIDLPTQYRGALIFRKGFENAVEWLFPRQFVSIKINSSMELFEENPANCVKDREFRKDGERTLRYDSHGNIYIE